MATPQTRPATTSTAALKGPAMSTPALASAGSIDLPGSNDPWDLMVNPMALVCKHGEIVPSVAKVYRTPGLNGNGPDRSGAGAVSRMARDGYVAVPHDFECIAWGASRAGSPLSTYIDRYEQVDPDGRIVKVWHIEPWRRFRMLGHIRVTDFDAEGYLDFHVRLMKFISPGELDKAQIEIATRNLFRDIRDQANRGTARGNAQVAVLLAHVPKQYAPKDIIALMEAHK